MEQAFEILLGQGVLGAFLIIVIVYFRSKEKKHDEIVAAKEQEIKELNEKLHGFGIDAVTAVKEIANNLKELVYEIKR
jgi:Flp pilus assembly protein protease CpaA